MSTETNKDLVRTHFEQIFNRGNLSVADRIYSPMVVLHDPMAPPLSAGIDGIKQYVRLYRSPIPDLHFEVKTLIAEGNFVAALYTAQGTHRNTFLGIAPTGKFGIVTGATIYRIEDDRIAEMWVHWDVMGLLRQLGVQMPVKVGAEVHI